MASVAQGDDAPEAKAEGRAISKALASLLAKAKAMGCANPLLFFESESGAVFVMDGDHPGEANSARSSAAERQEAIVLRCPISTAFDTGAW